MADDLELNIDFNGAPKVAKIKPKKTGIVRRTRPPFSPRPSRFNFPFYLLKIILFESTIAFSLDSFFESVAWSFAELPLCLL